MKKIVLIMVSMLIITGCGKKETAPVQKSKGKCTVFECIDQLNNKNTIEEMNNIIGFEGELKSETEKYKVYQWNLTDDTSITSQFMLDYDTATISANYPSSMVSNKADFSKWNEIKSRLSKREEITYDEFVKMVGGVQGMMKQKDSTSTSYVWYNSEGGYLTAYFNSETGKCTMATGRF